MILSSPDPACDPAYAARLLRLQHASYALEAALLDDTRLPPLREDEVELAAWRGRWLAAWDGVDLLGAVAWREAPDVVEIDKVMVDPGALRRGVASTMLGRVLDEAGEREVLVATGTANRPAIALYATLGFRREAEEQVPPGIRITRLRRP